MIKSLMTIAAALLFAGSAYAGEVKCHKVTNPKIADRSKEFQQVTIWRTAIPGVETKSGQVAVEVFGLTEEDAAVFKDSIEFVEACDTPQGPSLRYKVDAYPENGKHVAEIPLPPDAKGLKVRWCSKSEGGCPMEGVYTGHVDVTLKGQSGSRRPSL